MEQPAAVSLRETGTKRLRAAARRPKAGDAGWSSPVARQAHNLKVVGSNPTPATNFQVRKVQALRAFFVPLPVIEPLTRSRVLNGPRGTTVRASETSPARSWQNRSRAAARGRASPG